MKLRFTHKTSESDGVWSFFFEPAEKLEWVAGQSIRLELPRPTWGVDERRFTIASAPHEGHVRITTRQSPSGFKENLLNLQPGAEINGLAIEGNFVWGDEPEHRVFIAAGIGITPYRALLSQRIHDQQPLATTLIYSSKDTPPVFLTELEDWATKYPDFTLFTTTKRLQIGAEASLLNTWRDSIMYISGPEAMVKTLASELTSLGIPPDQIKSDEFTGNV